MKKLLLALLFLTSPVFAQTQTQYYTVPTIAALKAMTTSRPQVVQVVDSNPGIFNLSSGACSAADDIFQVQPTSGTTVCYTRMATKYSIGSTPLPGANGGTGVANTGKTITLGGNLTTTGAFNATFAIPGTGTWTFPVAGSSLAPLASPVFTGVPVLPVGTAPTGVLPAVAGTIVGAGGVGFYQATVNFNPGDNLSLGFGAVRTQRAAAAGGDYGVGPVTISPRGTIMFGGLNGSDQQIDYWGGEATAVYSEGNTTGGRMVGHLVVQASNNSSTTEPQLLCGKLRGKFSNNTLAAVQAGDAGCIVQAFGWDGVSTLGSNYMVAGNIEINFGTAPYTAVVNAQIAGNTLTINSISSGAVYPGQNIVQCTGCTTNTNITGYAGFVGGKDTWTIAGSPQTVTARAMTMGNLVGGNIAFKTTKTPTALGTSTPSDYAGGIDSNHVWRMYGNVEARNGNLRVASLLTAAGGAATVTIENGLTPSGGNTDAGYLEFKGYASDGGNPAKVFGDINVRSVTNTVAGANGWMDFNLFSAGTRTSQMRVDGVNGGVLIGNTSSLTSQGRGTLNLGGLLYFGGNSFTTSGNFSTVLTVAANTNVTLPSSGTLATTAATTLSSLASIGTITTGVWNAGAVTSTGTLKSNGGTVEAISAASQGIVNIQNDSAPGVAAESLGQVTFNGRSSTSVGRTYASIFGQANVVTNGAEYGSGELRSISAGSVTKQVYWGSASGSVTGGVAIGNSTTTFGLGTLNVISSLYMNGIVAMDASRNVTAASVTGTTATFSALPSDAATTNNSMCVTTTTGVITKGSGTIGVCLGTSSARYKHDVVDARGGLDKIEGLRPVSYKYNGGDERPLYGFIAEEVARAIPELVSNDNEGRVNSVDMLGMVPFLVNAIKELKVANDDIREEMRLLRAAK